MRINPQLKMDVIKLVVITFSYILINLFLVLLNHSILNSSYSLGPSDSYNLINNITFNIINGLVAGIVGGSILITINGRYFRRKSFLIVLFITIVSYIIIFYIIMLIATYLNFYNRINNEFVLSHFFEENFKLLKEPTVLNYFFLYGFITLGTLFMLQINDKFGPGILWKFIAGKYHQPNIEKRIFMFLDMRSSTSIAEKIGNKKYFLLLNEIIADITATILNSEGEIYQYVGDEIVISWPMKKGIRNENFIRCFIQIKKKLLLKENHYKQKFGILPELKAGLHFGNVVAGEVGVIKKEIVYSGDVLNTTARIQEMCNHYGVDFLVSKEALGLIKETRFFEMTALGSIQLRGKKQKVEISSIKYA